MAGLARGTIGLSKLLRIIKLVLFSLIPAFMLLIVLELTLRVMPTALIEHHNVAVRYQKPRGLALIVAGDSLPFGYGVAKGMGWAALLEKAASSARMPVFSFQTFTQPGADIDVAARLLSPYLRKLPQGVRPVVILQIGHNDFVLTSELVKDRAPGVAPATPGREQAVRNLITGLQLYKAMGWLFNSLHPSFKPVKVDAARIDHFKARLHELVDLVATRNGRIYLVTYLIPGQPRSGMEAEFTRNTQLIIGAQQYTNALLLKTGRELRLDTIDLPSRIRVPSSWSSEWFLDSIHVTSAVHQKIAASIADQLKHDGIL